MTAISMTDWTRARPQPNWLARLFDYKPFLVFMCLVPALGLLTVFLTYPLGLGIWLSFTDTKIGGSGKFIGRYSKLSRPMNLHRHRRHRSKPNMIRSRI